MAGWPGSTESILNAGMQAFGTSFLIFPIDPDGKIATVGTNQNGVFDDETEEVDLDAADEFKIITHAPKIGIKLTDFVIEPKVEDQIERNGQRYEIMEINQDGQGGVDLILHELK